MPGIGRAEGAINLLRVLAFLRVLRVARHGHLHPEAFAADLLAFFRA
jgi:hypothetical protein